MFAEAVKETEQNAAQQYEMRLAAATYFEEEGGDLEAASANCREAIRLNAKDVRGIAQYAGLLVRHHKDWLLADKYFRQAIKMDPHHSEATLGYAAFLMDVRQNADAAEHYYKLCVKASPRAPGRPRCARGAADVARRGVAAEPVGGGAAGGIRALPRRAQDRPAGCARAVPPRGGAGGRRRRAAPRGRRLPG
jgi:tetratricopeptide (TPR) repeat protein